MRYEATMVVSIKGRDEEDCVARLIESLFEFGTITDSLADGLQLDDNPRLLDVVVKRSRRDAKPPAW